MNKLAARDYIEGQPGRPDDWPPEKHVLLTQAEFIQHLVKLGCKDSAAGGFFSKIGRLSIMDQQRRPLTAKQRSDDIAYTNVAGIIGVEGCVVSITNLQKRMEAQDLTELPGFNKSSVNVYNQLFETLLQQ